MPIVLAGRIVLWLTTDHNRRGDGELGLLGCSAAIHALRVAVRDAAVLRGPIVIRGETGTGKAQRLAQIARAGRIATLDQLGLGDDLELAEAEPDDAAGDEAGGAGGRRAAIDDDSLVAALRAHGFQLSRTAAALGISRSHLDALIVRSPRIRKANQLSRDEVAACLAEVGGDVDAATTRLEVSPRGLRLRIKQLGMDR